MIRLVNGGRVDLLAPVQSLRRFGVPVGGAFDPMAAKALAQLLPGPGDLRILECSAADAQFAAESDCAIAYWSLARAGRVRLSKGDVFSLPVLPGMRGWVAVRSLDDSKSVVSRLVEKGEILPAMDLNISPRTVDPDWLPKVPQEIHYLPNETRIFGELRFTVDLRMDRKGIQLSGDLPTHHLELPSAPTVPGSLQWTPGGSVLLLGPDGPTIGGYPPIGTVPSIEFTKVAQLKPMSEVTLLPVNLGELRAMEDNYQSLWEERFTWLSKF